MENELGIRVAYMFDRGESGRPDFDERWVLACLRYTWCFEAAWKKHWRYDFLD